MVAKTTGAELKCFYEDESFWPSDVWIEEVELEVDGKLADLDFSIENDLKAESQVRILGGFIESEDGRLDCSFEAYFRRWRKKQQTVFLSVSVPTEKLDAVKAAIKAAGGKIES